MAEIITREDTIKYLCKNMTWYDEDGSIADDDIKLDRITDLVYGIQGVEERKVGKILINDKYRVPMYECLGCNHPVMKYWKYCPNCGNNIEERKNE